MMLGNSGRNYNQDYDLTNLGASLPKDELDRLLHCPICKQFMETTGPKRVPLSFNDEHVQWQHKECAT